MICRAVAFVGGKQHQAPLNIATNSESCRSVVKYYLLPCVHEILFPGLDFLDAAFELSIICLSFYIHLSSFALGVSACPQIPSSVFVREQLFSKKPLECMNQGIGHVPRECRNSRAMAKGPKPKNGQGTSSG